MLNNDFMGLLLGLCFIVCCTTIRFMKNSSAYDFQVNMRFNKSDKTQHKNAISHFINFYLC